MPHFETRRTGRPSQRHLGVGELVRHALADAGSRRRSNGILAALVAVCLTGCAAIDRPTVYGTDLHRYIRKNASGEKWGTQIPLIPTVLPEGASRKEVEGALRWSSYDLVSPVEQKRMRLLNPALGEGEVAQRHVNGFPCFLAYFVVVKFDSSDHLQRADGLVHELGCV